MHDGINPFMNQEGIKFDNLSVKKNDPPGS